jgi:hypothetical protein
MDRDRLSLDLQTTTREPGEAVYVERRGLEFAWRRCRPDADGIDAPAELPDSWIFYSGPWPGGDGERWPAFFEDLMAELDSMTGSADRCRWPIDEPYPHTH